MKTLAFILLAFISYSACAQKSIFVRIYDLNGKKNYAGHVFSVNDSALELKGNKVPKNIALSQIGYIKTKRSAVNNLAIGSIIGATTVAIAGAASAEPDAYWFAYTASEGAAAGAILGLPMGAAIGAITIPFKNVKTFLINGDSIKWKVFQSFLQEKSNEVK